ncbi:MAG: SDR family NAD(P)-dependent oxidoreductase [Dehalococcoidia bacterium]
MAAKMGVVGLTKSLAVELAPYGITVNCVAPGVLRSEVPASEVAWTSPVPVKTWGSSPATAFRRGYVPTSTGYGAPSGKASPPG